MDKLTELTEAYEKIGKEIEALKTPAPWEPKAYEYATSLLKEGCAYGSSSGHGPIAVKIGRTYPTREAAEKASKFFIFYQRLYALAFEMNQKHKPRKFIRFGVYLSPSNDWYAANFLDSRTSSVLFTSRKAAQEAADIMNRDQWTLPTL